MSIDTNLQLLLLLLLLRLFGVHLINESPPSTISTLPGPLSSRPNPSN